ncbi:hypothetical protein B566_EDAN000714 [Ephemera danica]|nr:hypothetical protein B566_EDAN000714 [Ephemera danica]
MNIVDIHEHESLWTQQHRDLLENKRWTDCAFRLVQCHKLLLSAASPVFAAMLYGDLAEEDGTEISIPDISAEAFRLLV